MIRKVWDVMPPTDNWERHYAKMEYLRIGLLKTFAKQIEVTNG